MWRHVELDRLYKGAQGAPLDESETDHLLSCELCQELLIFFKEHALNPPKPEIKAA